MSTIKALIPGGAITLLVSGALYGAGNRGGVLALEQSRLLEMDFYWSWPLFLLTFALSRVLLFMIEA